MSDDSDDQPIYEYIERSKDNKPLSSQYSDEDDVVLITTIKTRKSPKKGPTIIQLRDQEIDEEEFRKKFGFCEEEELSSSCPKFKSPPFNTQNHLLPPSLEYRFEEEESAEEIEVVNEEENEEEYEENEEINDNESKLRQRLRELRKQYIEAVQEAIKEFSKENEKSSFVGTNVPRFEDMRNEEMEAELATYGFRFTTRSSAISKLVRIWYAINERNGELTGAPAREPKITTPVEFIRLKSKYYEDILTYTPIPLIGL